MPVPSTITDLSDSAASNFPQDTDSTGSTVASLPRNLSAIIKKQFIRGSDVAVAASGSVTLNAEYSYFVVTGSGYNITGFSDAYNGRKVTLKFSGALTLVHSASLILPSAANITTVADDVLQFINESSGVWRCSSTSGNGLTATNATNSSQLGGVAAASYALLASPALTGNPTSPTAAQFDNDTSIATTAFVQRALGNLQSSGAYISGGSPSLVASDAGKQITLSGSTTGVLYLPVLSTVADGASFLIKVEGTTNNLWTIACAGADGNGMILEASAVANTGSLVSGAWVLFTKGLSAWRAHGNFIGASASLASNGYQKLPSGLIVQWVSGVTDASGRFTGSWPIAFPNNYRLSVANAGAGAVGTGSVKYACPGSGVSASNYDFWINTATAGTAVTAIAVGN